MKRILTLMLVSSLTIAPVFDSWSQCTDEDFLDGCASLLDTYTFVKSFNVNMEGTKGGAEQSFSYVFSKGTTYMITVCDQNSAGKKMIVELYDRNRKLVGISYNKKTKKHYTKIEYPCLATGVYYLKYKFEDEKASCGVSILGFKKGIVKKA